jgi:hypothetical protein
VIGLGRSPGWCRWLGTDREDARVPAAAGGARRLRPSLEFPLSTPADSRVTGKVGGMTKAGRRAGRAASNRSRFRSRASARQPAAGGSRPTLQRSWPDPTAVASLRVMAQKCHPRQPFARRQPIAAALGSAGCDAVALERRRALRGRCGEARGVVAQLPASPAIAGGELARAAARRPAEPSRGGNDRHPERRVPKASGRAEAALILESVS